MGAVWTRACWTIAVVAIVAFGAVVVLAPTSGLALAFDNLGTTLAAAVAGVACLRASRPSDRAAGRTRSERGWWFIGLAGLAWAAGNSAWAVQEVLLGDDIPFPSVADIGYLATIPLALMGVLALGPPLRGVGTVKQAMDVLLIAVGLVGVGWVVVLAPVASSTEGALEQTLSLTYAIGDLVIVAAVLSVISLLHRRPWALGLLLAGVCLLAVADASFAVLTSTGSYESGGFPAWAWFTGFVCMALSARPLPPQPENLAAEAVRQGQDWPAEVLAHVPALLVGGLAMVERFRDGRMSDAALVLIFVVGVLNALRHHAGSRRTAALTRALGLQVRELQEQRERTHLVIDEARDPYVEMDRDGRVTVWNGPAEAVFGWSAEDIVGRLITEIVPEENREASRHRLAEFVETGDATVWDEGVDVRYLRPDGTEVPVEIAAWHTGEGDAYRVHAFVWDISERKAEMALLEQSEERWRALVRHSSDITVLLDPAGNLSQSVPTVNPILGYEDGEFDGHHFAQLLHPDDVEWVTEAFLAVAGHPGRSDTARFRLRRIDGSWAHVEGVLTNLVDVPAVGGIVCNLRDVSAQVEAENVLRRQARRDPLTGLPNRNLLTDALARHCEAEVPGHAALLLMDLNGFKDVNDGLGHDVGDQLLVEIGHRLDRVTRSEDVVARLGGDEFAVLLTRLPSFRLAVNVAENLNDLIREPVRLGDVNLEVGVSIGIADVSTGDDPLAVLQRADVAMYRAKRQGRGFAVYGSEDDEERRNSVKVAADLRHGIDREDLVVHYQPKIELATGLVDSVEALVRWQHPVRGLLPPDQFIALAERTGLIRDLTARVLDLALDQSARWRSEGMDLPVAVNLSPRVLSQTDLVSTVRDSLARAGLPAGHLTLEITESAFPENTRLLSTTLDQLGELGVRLSVDDFGTGWSSLSKLKELPVQELKIDRSFVFALAEDVTDHSIVKTVLELGRSLGLTVVAEGVETEAVADLLTHLGCPFAQGYLYSRPVSGPELTGWILERDRQRNDASANGTDQTDDADETAGGSPLG